MRWAAALCAIAGLWAIAGCGSVPPTHYYVLETPRPVGPGGGDTGARAHVVGVTDFRVDPPYDRDTLVYRVAAHPTEVGFYDYHRWAAPLERMLPVVFARGLSLADGATAFEPAVPGRAYAALLHGRVTTIEEIDHADREEVRLRVELVLALPDGSQLWSYAAAGGRALDADEVVEIAEAMNATLAELVQEARPAVAAALGEHRQRIGAGH
ncbi:MAG TPA: ABC-type transport auxiliary lipoprotein family protein [Candidatus Polarisedimenticolaceae bacterium]|nr:ABC-type transport auxiliary lipoprotein family protein [Candidatus Polarisedimenticolaceae bacterium]